jgi:hypothetical protein
MSNNVFVKGEDKMRKISISLVLALCISMLLGSVVFAQNTAAVVNVGSNDVTLIPPTGSQIDQAIIDAAAKDTFGIYFGSTTAKSSGVDWDHDGWTEWRNFYTEKRACCTTTAYRNGQPVSHYSVAWLQTPAGQIVGRNYDYGVGYTSVKSEWGYAGFTAMTGYGLNE